jgi:hypothetical protein
MKIGFVGMLFLILMTLKFVGVITLSWWWVFGIPVIISVVAFVLLCVLVVLFKDVGK